MLIQIFSLVLHFAVGLVAGTCLLRMYMHLMGISLSRSGGSPLAPFVFAISNWIVLPVRRYVPALGRLDTASLVAAYAVLLAKHSLLWIVAGATSDWLGLFVNAGFELLNVMLSSLMWMVIGYALMSWFSAAEPEMKSLTLPPRRSRIFEKTSLSAIPYCAPSIPPGALPFASSASL